MNIKNQRGITLLMLVITIVVILIIATVLISYSVGDRSILETAKNVKMEEEIRTLKSKVDSEIKSKQEIEGRIEGVTLTKEEQAEILEDYFSDRKLVVDKNGKLCIYPNSNWEGYEDILKKYDITTINANNYVEGTE